MERFHCLSELNTVNLTKKFYFEHYKSKRTSLSCTEWASSEIFRIHSHYLLLSDSLKHVPDFWLKSGLHITFHRHSLPFLALPHKQFVKVTMFVIKLIKTIWSQKRDVKKARDYCHKRLVNKGPFVGQIKHQILKLIYGMFCNGRFFLWFTSFE